MTSQQKHYNYRISRARTVAENAFGRLKTRWRRLMKTNEMRLVNVPTVIAACCVLHNVCEVHGESLNERWIEDSSDDNMDLPQPPRVTSRDDSATEKANDI